MSYTCMLHSSDSDNSSTFRNRKVEEKTGNQHYTGAIAYKNVELDTHYESDTFINEGNWQRAIYIY